MQSETGFPSSHQLKSYVASKSHLKLAAHAVLSADAGLLVIVRLKNERQMWQYELHPPHLISVATLLCEKNTKNVILQQDIIILPKKIVSDVS